MHHYLNKKPLSNSELKNIITLENKKLNDLFPTNNLYNRESRGDFESNKNQLITKYNYLSFDIGMVYSITLAQFLVEKGLNINNFKYKRITTFWRSRHTEIILKSL